jgi:hypothetical protein
MRTLALVGGWWLAGWWVIGGTEIWRVVWMAAGFAVILIAAGLEENASARRRAELAWWQYRHRVLVEEAERRRT